MKLRLPAGAALAMLCLFTPCSNPARAENLAPDALFNAMIDTYADIDTVRADFVQESHFAGFSAAKRFAGTLDIARPDRMRWDYRDGSNQQIYVNGRQVTLYAPDSRQAMVSTLSPASDRQIPIQLLADVTRITDLYEVGPTEEAGMWMLRPKEPHPQAPERIEMGIDPKTRLIDVVVLHLPGGNSSRITFDNQRVNAEIDPSRFRFEAPEGVHVVHPETLLRRSSRGK